MVVEDKISDANKLNNGTSQHANSHIRVAGLLTLAILTALTALTALLMLSTAYAIEPKSIKDAIIGSQLSNANRYGSNTANPEAAYTLETLTTNLQGYESNYASYKESLDNLVNDTPYMRRNLRGIDDLRRSIIVSFQRGKYAEVVSSYNNENLNSSLNQYSDELSLLYSIALLQQGSYNAGTAILSNLAQKPDSKDITKHNFNLIAMDVLAQYAVENNNFDLFLKSFNRYANKASDYATATYLQYLLVNSKFKELENIEKNNPEIKKRLRTNPKLNEFKTKGYYLTRKYDKVLTYGREFNTPNTYDIVLDSAAILANATYLESYILRIPNGKLTNTAQTKLAITLATNNTNNTTILNKNNDAILKALEKQNQDFLEIYTYYQYKFNNNINTTIVNTIYNQSSTIARTYMDTDNTLRLISKLQCTDAITYINKNMPRIPLEVNLLLGECLLIDNNEIAKKYLYTFLDNTNKRNNDYWKAKSLLALSLFSNNETVESSIIIDDCKTDNCNLVRSYSQLKQRKYVTALNTAKTIHNPSLTNITTNIQLLSLYGLGKCNNVIAIAKNNTFNSETTSYAIADCYLTQNNEKLGLKYLNTHIKTNTTYTKLGMKYFFNKEEYNKTITLGNNINSRQLDSDIALLLGYSYHSIGEYNNAYRYYKAIATTNNSNTPMGIDSMINIWSNVTAYNATQDITTILLTNKNIDNREVYLMKAATLFTKSNLINEAFQLVNTLFDDYSKPEAIRGAYVVRAELFYQLQNYNACLADVQTGLSYKKNDEAPLLYYNALCNEHLNPEASLKTYQQLRQYPEFEYLANEKVIKLSDNPRLLLDSANYFADKDQNLYNKGIQKFLLLVPLFELAQNTNYLPVLENSEDANTRAKGYFLRAQLAERNTNHTKAIANYLLAFYTTTDEISKKQAKENLVEIYTKLGLTERVEIINKL